MKVNPQEKDSVIVINAYAPTFSAEDEKVEQSADSDSKYKIILGGFIAKI